MTAELTTKSTDLPQSKQNQPEPVAATAKLEEIESRLSNLFRRSKADWTEMAKLTLKVQREKLYKQRGLSSFTQWVKQTAVTNNREQSLLWRFVKAAKYFLKLTDSDSLDRIHEAASIPPEALEKLEKVQRQAPTPVFETLKERVFAGEATVAECRQIEKDYRPTTAERRTNRGRPPKGEEGKVDYLGKWKDSSSDESQLEGSGDKGEKIPELTSIATSISSSISSSQPLAVITRRQVAPSIKRAIKADYTWMQECAQMRYPPRNWDTHEEVRISFQRQRLRLDLVGVVRWTLKRPKDLFVVEIKSCLQDFESDEKWERYLHCCNYFCFACPLEDEHLLYTIEEAASRIPSIGILGVNFTASLGKNLAYPVQVLRCPQRQGGEGNKISLVYETLYERVLGWSATNSAAAETISDEGEGEGEGENTTNSR